MPQSSILKRSQVAGVSERFKRLQDEWQGSIIASVYLYLLLCDLGLLDTICFDVNQLLKRDVTGGIENATVKSSGSGNVIPGFVILTLVK